MASSPWRRLAAIMASAACVLAITVATAGVAGPAEPANPANPAPQDGAAQHAGADSQRQQGTANRGESGGDNGSDKGRDKGRDNSGDSGRSSGKNSENREMQAIAPAEALLFQNNHLRNVRAPATLVYSFHHEETGAQARFDDQVRLNLDARRAATLQFLSGARQRRMPAVDDPEGNPVLLGFLEREIAEMHRLTGGSMNYFRKRIRMALANDAQVRSLRVAYGGKSIDGREVAIEPYRGDPMHARFEPYVGKRYLFVVSEHVPGGLYRLRAVVPGPGPGRGTPLADDTLTLAHVEEGRR